MKQENNLFGEADTLIPVCKSLEGYTFFFSKSLANHFY